MNRLLVRLCVLVLFAITSTLCLAEDKPVHDTLLQADVLSLPTVPLIEILDAVSKKTGEKFLINYRSPPEVVVGSMKLRNISYPILLTILRNNDLAASRSAGIVSIVPVGRIRQFPIPIVNEDDDSISDDEWVMRTIHVDNVPAAFFVPILRPLLPQAGHMAAHPDSNTLFFIARYGKVRLVAQLVREMDVKSDLGVSD